jgi:hypothetical protein
MPDLIEHEVFATNLRRLGLGIRDTGRVAKDFRAKDENIFINLHVEIEYFS